jgi:N-sulfoglucosamine sulfohydrolase
MVRNEEFMYILNARPLNPQSGPADAVGSSSYRELVALKDSGRLTAVQSDVFVVPRPREELYDLRADPGQYLNVASLPQYIEALQQLRGVLSVWMDDTGDNTPGNLTKDWYLREPGSTNPASQCPGRDARSGNRCGEQQQ